MVWNVFEWQVQICCQNILRLCLTLVPSILHILDYQKPVIRDVKLGFFP